jgi:protein-tyrosine phosphatase
MNFHSKMEDADSRHKMSIQPTEHLRSTIPSAPNLRDVGGHLTQDDRRVRTGMLYRSEQRSGITEADMPVFEHHLD